MSPLDALLVPFNTPAVTIAGSSTSWGEIGGFVTGALCVWLVARQNSWNWPIGILNNLAFLALFATSGLYADSGLQLVFITLSLYGWWSWLRGGEHHGTLPVSRTTGRQWIWLAAAGAAMTLMMVAVLRTYTTSTVPWADAVTTSLSLLATWGQTRKKVESWWLWIAADVIYVPLYAYKNLWLTALLYLGFIYLCVVGLRAWSGSARELKLAPV
jgi:nicotinamide mononucleotide transporter